MRKGSESVYDKFNISVVNFERTNLYATSVIDDPSPIYIVSIRFILLSKDSKRKRSLRLFFLSCKFKFTCTKISITTR